MTEVTERLHDLGIDHHRYGDEETVTMTQRALDELLARAEKLKEVQKRCVPAHYQSPQTEETDDEQ